MPTIGKLVRRLEELKKGVEFKKKYPEPTEDDISEVLKSFERLV
jgi:hypothetical protein